MKKHTDAMIDFDTTPELQETIFVEIDKSADCLRGGLLYL